MSDITLSDGRFLEFYPDERGGTHLNIWTHEPEHAGGGRDITNGAHLIGMRHRQFWAYLVIQSARERIEQLESVLLELLERSQEKGSVSYVQGESIPYTTCLICHWEIDDEGHAPDCPVEKARKLLEEPK